MFRAENVCIGIRISHIFDQHIFLKFETTSYMPLRADAILIHWWFQIYRIYLGENQVLTL